MPGSSSAPTIAISAIVGRRQVDRREPLRERRRVPGSERRDDGDRPLGGGPVAALAGQRGEAQEDVGRHRPARGRGVVLDVLRAGDELFVVVGRVEEPAGGIGEPLEDGRP